MAKKKPQSRVTVANQIEKESKPNYKEIDDSFVKAAKGYDKGGRPIKESAIGREKFTTMLLPKWKVELKVEAVRKGITTADLMEEILKERYSK